MINKNNTDCPCAFCKPPKRSAGCHGYCQEYLDWNDDRLAKKAEISKAKASDWDYRSYVIKTVKKAKGQKETESTKRRN